MRLAWILVTSLSCAAMALTGSLLALTLEVPSEPEASARMARIALSDDQRATRNLLALSCERDTVVERLALELAASRTDADAASALEALTRSLGGQVRLFWEEAGRVAPLAGSPALDRTLLTAAAHRRVAQMDGDALMLLDACVHAQGSARLWVVRHKPLTALLRAAGLEREQFSVTPEAQAPELEVQRFTNANDAPVHLAARRTANARRVPTGLWFWALGAALLGALLALGVTRERPLDERVLSTLEQAAERVAQGDLSSQIGLTLGHRADQTFRSFDRMTAELRETRAKLAEAERASAFRDIAQRVAHEIKNPLSPMRTALETLRKAHARQLDSFDEIFDESTRAMLEEVQRIEHIVREFSEFARLPKARPGALDLDRLVHDTVRLYAPDDVPVGLACDETVRVHADREQLVQVVINLLSNAVDAARESARPTVRLSVHAAQDAAVLRVEDSGQGVAPSDRERIFEPYVTLKQGGTGLGLAIVKRIVQDHGGSIAVFASALGGAGFEVRLPMRSGDGGR